MPPKCSIILPTWNGERELARLLPALERQELAGGYELLAVDSDSSDGTRELLGRAGARVTRIERAGFRHGATRNLCAADARGELLVFLSQDVLPADERFLAELAAAFDDPRVAGATARILPHPDDDPLTARTVLDRPEASAEPFARDLDATGGRWELAPEERALWLRFNNVASAIRTAVFRTIPFPDVDFGEDLAWAARALTAGHRIRFAPRAVAFHAHAYTPAQAFRRYRVDAAFHREVHGCRVRPSAWSVVRGILHEVGRDWRYLRESGAKGKVRHMLRSPGLRGAQVIGQYIGSRG